MPKYRDRAAERRVAFNQPDKPVLEDGPSQPGKRKFAEGPKPMPPLPEPGMEPGKDEANVGNQLLAKMGWKTGTGLGREGEGRVDREFSAGVFLFEPRRKLMRCVESGHGCAI